MIRQQTIAEPVDLSGRGLFTGHEVNVRFKPAATGTGIVFVRTDQGTEARIPAHVSNISKRARRTSIRNGTVAIETIEHCLSACAGLGIDNLEIELDSDELPAGDGSCTAFVDVLRRAGVCEQEATRDFFVIPEMVRVSDGDFELLALPPLQESDRFFEIRYDLDYGGVSSIGRQWYMHRLFVDDYEKEIAPARTFVLDSEVAELRAGGLGLHLTYDDIVVFGEDGPIKNELRFENECVRHKIQDLIGDLMLLGRFIIGRVYARKSGHALNHELVRRLIAISQAKHRASLLAERPVYDIRRIRRVLPHRYPFLLIDRVIELDGNRRAVGLKNVTMNEEFFQGHYPGQPIMPGVLIIEAMSQIGGVLLSQDLEHKGKIAVLLSMDKVKFRRPVTPGDQLILEAESARVKANVGQVHTVARVGDTIVAEADIKFMLVDADPEE